MAKKTKGFNFGWVFTIAGMVSFAIGAILLQTYFTLKAEFFEGDVESIWGVVANLFIFAGVGTQFLIYGAGVILLGIILVLIGIILLRR
jgi:hypothetical protein